jgi:hypothetical protein
LHLVRTLDSQNPQPSVARIPAIPPPEGQNRTDPRQPCCTVPLTSEQNSRTHPAKDRGTRARPIPWHGIPAAAAAARIRAWPRKTKPRRDQKHPAALTRRSPNRMAPLQPIEQEEILLRRSSGVAQRNAAQAAQPSERPSVTGASATLSTVGPGLNPKWLRLAFPPNEPTP